MFRFKPSPPLETVGAFPPRLSLWFLSLLFIFACTEEADRRFDSPYATFKTRQQALAQRDFDLLWTCFSTTYKTDVHKGDFATWEQDWRQKSDEDFAAELQREIAEERLINQRIAYLLFDTSTLDTPRTSPFFYFIREPEGWKMTTFLDSVFHRELEQAIERGEFRLPHD